VDVCAQGQCDYNGSFNFATSPNKGYEGAWSAVTPGAFDLDEQDPDFLDRTRKVENWDRKYLGPAALITEGQASPGEWTAGPYAAGDLASHAHASLYGGETLNFRCKIASCTVEPGVPGTAWRNEWEFAALYHLRNLVAAQTQVTDETIGCDGCYAVAAMHKWVRAGFATRNPALRGSAHDGGDVGAVPWVAAPNTADQVFQLIWGMW
jgi:hypothetical protein